MRWLVILAVVVISVHPSPGQDAARGKKLLTERAFIKAFWPRAAYENLWRVWGLSEKPKNYAAAVGERFGLPPAPYPNDGLPMGLRKANMVLGTGISIDCLTCHGGSIFGEPMIGLGNISLDMHALFEELGQASSNPLKLPFNFAQVRGTNEAGAFSVYLLGLRNDDLSLRVNPRDLGLQEDSCEDTPAWWLLKKKKTMYHTGSNDARSIRSLMQFLMHPLTSASEFPAEEANFRDIQAYLLSLEAPKYPLPIDREQARVGEQLFTQHCSTCHGTYGEKWTYPNKIIPLEKIGTDAKRYHNLGPKFAAAYNASWFAQSGPQDRYELRGGYQAPPLDGIWATAPYFHNGSVPTLEGVLNSATRPKLFTRSYGTGRADYDEQRVGWKVEVLSSIPKDLKPIDRRRYYDTTQPGRGNQGHTYGDALTAEERAALIEYLKTL